LEWYLPEGLRDPTSPACLSQIALLETCRRVSLAEIEDSVRALDQTTDAAGVDLLLVNLDFAGTPAWGPVGHVAKVRDIRVLDHVKQVRHARLLSQIDESRRLGLAPPLVPFVPVGKIGPPLRWGRGPQMRFRIKAEGGATSVRMVGSANEDGRFRFDQELLDDATLGDEIAADGVFSATVEFPVGTTSAQYEFLVDGVPELRSSPSLPSQYRLRSLAFNREGIAPIETFGERHGMADRIHPNADGHRLIEDSVMNELLSVPSFRRYVGLPIETSTAR
jgi:hypothetical protein